MRVVVFVDHQNVYMGARDVYGKHDPHFVFGQFSPWKLALRLRDKRRERELPAELEHVHVFRGRPRTSHVPARPAFDRQTQTWTQHPKITLHTAGLQYRHGEDPREKGIDVKLALELVLGAYKDEYDVAIVVSADTDLVPAVAAARAIGKTVEVAVWQPDDTREFSRPLKGADYRYFLTQQDFHMVADATDYTRNPRTRPR